MELQIQAPAKGYISGLCSRVGRGDYGPPFLVKFCSIFKEFSVK